MLSNEKWRQLNLGRVICPDRFLACRGMSGTEPKLRFESDSSRFLKSESLIPTSIAVYPTSPRRPSVRTRAPGIPSKQFQSSSSLAPGACEEVPSGALVQRPAALAADARYI